MEPAQPVLRTSGKFATRPSLIRRSRVPRALFANLYAPNMLIAVGVYDVAALEMADRAILDIHRRAVDRTARIVRVRRSDGATYSKAAQHAERSSAAGSNPVSCPGTRHCGKGEGARQQKAHETALHDPTLS